MYNILVVDDDKEIVESIEIYLKKEGFNIFKAYNGIEALEILVENEIHLILMDIMMPKLDGIKATIKIREEKNIPIILVSAKSEDTDKIDALDAGADDYLTKPFSVEELLARLRVTIRRLNTMKTSSEAEQSVYINGDLKIDYAARCVYMKDKELYLTPIEYKLLCLLAKNTGKVLTHTYITKEIWGNTWSNGVASLRVFMATLRKKIEKDPSAPQYIQTHIGVGYRMLKL